MKKSNKLLLGAFLTVILTITGIHIALYAKYKSGDYTIYHRTNSEDVEAIRKFPNVSFVVIRNVRDTYIQFSDTAQIVKDLEKDIQFEQRGDSLFITGHYKGENPDFTPQLGFMLPYNVSIEADSVSRVSLQSNQFFKAKIKTISNNP